MEIKDFLYEQDFSNIKKIFLYSNIANKSTTLTSLKNRKYKEIDLKFDCKQNLLLKFPLFEEENFEESWKKELRNFKDNDININEKMDSYAAELIFKINGDKIFEFIKKKIEELDSQQKEIVLNFLNNSPKNTKDFNCEYTETEGDFFISLGLLYKGSYYNSYGNLKNSNYYYYPHYLSNLKHKIIKYIHEILKSSKKKKKRKNLKKKSRKISTKLENNIFKLIVIRKGKKGKRKVKFGISKLGIGAEFGGQEQLFISFKCGNCGSLDRFTIENIEQKLFKCAKCQALNKPVGKDLYYFED